MFHPPKTLTNRFDINAHNVFATNISGHNIWAINISSASAFVNSMTIGTLHVTDSSTFENVDIEKLIAERTTMENVVITRGTASNFRITNGTVNNLHGTHGHIDNITSTNLITTYATIPNLFTTNQTAVNITNNYETVSNISFNNIIFTNATGTYLNLTSATATNLNLTNISVDNIDTSSIDTASLIATNLTANSIHFNNLKTDGALYFSSGKLIIGIDNKTIKLDEAKRELYSDSLSFIKGYDPIDIWTADNLASFLGISLIQLATLLGLPENLLPSFIFIRIKLDSTFFTTNISGQLTLTGGIENGQILFRDNNSLNGMDDLRADIITGTTTISNLRCSDTHIDFATLGNVDILSIDYCSQAFLDGNSTINNGYLNNATIENLRLDNSTMNNLDVLSMVTSQLFVDGNATINNLISNNLELTNLTIENIKHNGSATMNSLDILSATILETKLDGVSTIVNTKILEAEVDYIEGNDIYFSNSTFENIRNSFATLGNVDILSIDSCSRAFIDGQATINNIRGSDITMENFYGGRYYTNQTQPSQNTELASKEYVDKQSLRDLSAGRGIAINNGQISIEVYSTPIVSGINVTNDPLGNGRLIAIDGVLKAAIDQVVVANTVPIPNVIALGLTNQLFLYCYIGVSVTLVGLTASVSVLSAEVGALKSIVDNQNGDVYASQGALMLNPTRVITIPINTTNITTVNLNTSSANIIYLNSEVATIENLNASTGSLINLSSNNATFTNLVALNETVVNLVTTNETILNLIATDISTTNLTVGNTFSTNVSTTNLTVGNTFSTNVSATNLTVGNTFATNVSATNINVGTVSTSNLISSNLRATNEATIINTFFATNGNVGIGTTSPSVKLDVAGTVKITGGGSLIATSNNNTIGPIITSFTDTTFANLVPITNGLFAYYNASSWNGTHWNDLTTNGNHATTIGGTINTTTENNVTYLYGNTGASVIFPTSVLPSTYTFFHVAKYNGNAKERIFEGVSNNWLSGFWDYFSTIGNSGVAFHNVDFLGPNTGVTGSNNFLLSTDQKTLYRANGSLVGTNAGDSTHLSINNGYVSNQLNERSDWAIGEIIVYNRELTTDEIERTESWLMDKYSAFTFTTALTYSTTHTAGTVSLGTYGNIGYFVGISNTAPNYTLDVNGDINLTGDLYKNGALFGGSQWTGSIGSTISYTSGNVNVVTATFTTGGNVGIGTTSPNYRLSLLGNSGSTDGAHIVVTTTQDSFPVFQNLNWSHDNISLNFDMYFDGQWRTSSSSGFQIYKAENMLRFHSATGSPGSVTSFQTRMVLTTGGNVGIGTETPSFLLDVNGTFEANNASGVLCFASTGNVGIGTTSPSLTLEVNGTIGANAITTGALVAYLQTVETLVVTNETVTNNFTSNLTISNCNLTALTAEGIMVNNFTALNTTLGSIFTTGGNVGIGTTAPSVKLDINGNVRIRAGFNFYDSLQISTANGFPNGNNATSGTILLDAYDFGFFGGTYRPISIHGNVLNFSTGLSNYNTRLHIDNSGNVGINNTAPSKQFHIRGDNGSIRLTSVASNESSIEFYPNTASSTYFKIGNGISNFISQTNLAFFNSFTNKVNLVLQENGVLKHDSGSITNSNLLLTNNSQCGVITFHDNDHAIWGRRGVSGAIDRMEFHEYGDILFWTGGALSNQKLRFAVPDEDKVSFYFQQDNIAWHTDLYYDGDAYGFAFNYFAGPTNTGGYTGHGVKGFIDPFWNNSRMNFTGQHRSKFKDLDVSNIDNYVGLIVRSTGKYMSMNNEEMLSIGKDAISINESLPIVELTTTHKDKAVFGVVSNAEDPNKPRTDKFGCWGTPYEKQSGDNRVFVNGVGEGAIWVSNKNGNLENGDYITSSTIPGYGERQLEEYIANYTVAKITMDCDFNPQLQPKMQPQKDILGNNVLDTKGNIIWEQTGEYEYEYNIRYIDEYGNIITEEEYDPEIHYISAFVGCTYTSS